MGFGRMMSLSWTNRRFDKLQNRTSGWDFVHWRAECRVHH